MRIHFINNKQNTLVIILIFKICSYRPRLLSPEKAPLVAALESVSILSCAVHTRKISLLFVSKIRPPIHNSFKT